LDKGVSEYNPVIKKSIFFLQDRNEPLTFQVVTEKNDFAPFSLHFFIGRKKANHKIFFTILLVGFFRFWSMVLEKNSHYSNGQIFEVVGQAFSLFLQNVYKYPITFLLARKTAEMPKLFSENGEKTWGELDCFCQCSIAENPYISRVFDIRSSKQHWGF